MGQVSNRGADAVIPAETTAELLEQLQSKTAAEAATVTKQLLKSSKKDDSCLKHLEGFLSLLQSSNGHVRARGIQLVCAQAQWDTEGILEEHFQAIAAVLLDKRPTVVRQGIAALYEIVRYRPELKENILNAISLMNTDTFPGDAGVRIAAEAETLRKVILGEEAPPWERNKRRRKENKPEPVGFLILLAMLWGFTLFFSVILENPLLRYHLADERQNSRTVHEYAAAWNESYGGTEIRTTIRYRNDGEEKWHTAKVKTKDYMLFWVPAALSIAATPVLLSFAWTDYKKLKEQQNTPGKP